FFDQQCNCFCWPKYYWRMKSKGFTKVYALKCGWREWFRNKYPVVEK
ncbi:MAG: rhodanese-like domain-containing protein, partial [Desulfobacterales bacterium]